MGSGIAQTTAAAGYRTVVRDTADEVLRRGREGIERSLGKLVDKGTLAAPDREAALGRLTFVTALEALREADLVVEAVPEDLALKNTLWRALDGLAPAATIFASNTSSLRIGAQAAATSRPDRFVGLHFFNPVPLMPLVEVVRGIATSAETFNQAMAFARSLGKEAVVSSDTSGFLVNRLLLPYMNEAALMLCEGASIAEVEKAAKKFGMPMGPITLYDVVGLDVAVHAGRTMLEAFPDRVVPAAILAELVERGRLGQKAGRGFFDYPPAKGGKPPKGADSDEVAELIEACRQGTPRKFSSDKLADRLFLPMLVEATRVLEDGLVRDVRDVDLALIYGIGFPPFRGGLFFWADQVGPAKIVEKLAQYKSLGKRFDPTKMLTKLAESKSKFYD